MGTILVTSAWAGGSSSQDLLIQSRQWTITHGRAAARDQLEKAMVAQDDSRGTFEKRLWRTNADQSFSFPDAVANLSAAERARTGVYFVFGYQQHQGKSPPVIKATAKALAHRGFRAVWLPTPDRGTVEENAEAIAAYLRKDLPHVDRAIIIGFSKGSDDLLHFLAGPGAKFPAKERAKLRLMVNFAGILRGSSFANWAAREGGLRACLFRCFLNFRTGRPLTYRRDLDSIATDPWMDRPLGPLRAIAPSLLVISFVALPDGHDGTTRRDGMFHRLGVWSEDVPQVVGPNDGLVESAAAMLPPRAGAPQWIVRVRGSHALLDGDYLNGRAVAPTYPDGKKGRLRAGIAVMDDLLRALPKSTIGMGKATKLK